MAMIGEIEIVTGIVTGTVIEITIDEITIIQGTKGILYSLYTLFILDILGILGILGIHIIRTIHIIQGTDIRDTVINF